ncbi:hypothetical protein JX265_010983 [Neoarthrinium moseri]|uniref:Uncharacterized protein n=1 Tax=Neoarthrinium moseri TaxID=1658444 RepID=A0A9P9WDC2_9PEZI|nr:uncharacterized protein JN550_009652 [Neoarthrinium moseri]KAI1851749.1 hypothetical protein JX266_003211 [Neoarthrinium moseri]KAI1857953.1 hypothetical protein JX265_010983 [Neoarthrinium moseri]KAI1863332.1 hypothetical protein JN550_009652 [Neoarthrinium moseri]
MSAPNHYTTHVSLASVSDSDYEFDTRSSTPSLTSSVDARRPTQACSGVDDRRTSSGDPSSLPNPPVTRGVEYERHDLLRRDIEIFRNELDHMWELVGINCGSGIDLRNRLQRLEAWVGDIAQAQSELTVKIMSMEAAIGQWLVHQQQRGLRRFYDDEHD